MKIGIISDTHSHMDNSILEALQGSEEIWHIGDLGDIEILKPLEKIAPVRGVFGNADDQAVRHEWPLDLHFETEGMNVYMTHIGGYPGKYPARVKALIEEHKPDIFLSGHSHILKVMPDKQFNLLHINPGAAGHHGFHAIRTIVRLQITGGKIENLEVVELGRRGRV
jgi:putative phosphoesterase